MVGATNGPELPTPGDLVADVAFDMGNGCGEFNYGYEEADGGTDTGNTAPTAVIKSRKKAVKLGETHFFDGSRSTDEESSDQLDYSWDFGDGGVTKDAVGARVDHEFADPGVYKVRLTVTDPRGETDRALRKVRVYKNIQCARPKITRSGGWENVHSPAAERNHYCENSPGKTAGDTMSLDFQGSRVALKWGRAKDGGSAQVLVDGERIDTISFKSRSAEPKFRDLQVFKGLGSGRHTLEIVVDPPAGKRRLAYIDYIRVYGNSFKTQ
jgi:hypothetical protein